MLMILSTAYTSVCVEYLNAREKKRVLEALTSAVVFCGDRKINYCISAFAEGILARDQIAVAPFFSCTHLDFVEAKQKFWKKNKA